MSTFISSISSVIVVILIIALGYTLRIKDWFADTFSGNISKLIMQIALPASIFVSVQKNLTKDSLGQLFEGM
ncbi:AEC family transporter, partial [Lactobacillus mulieris]|nr:AEC family transporter [Lactobacillus mulieris]